MMKKIILLILYLTSLSLTACGIFSSDKDAYKGMSAEKIFQIGQKNLKSENYSTAAKAFEALISDYPFGDLAERSSLDLIYAYYQADDLTSSVGAADSYIHLYPRSDSVDYAYYMRGLANFNQDRGLMLRYFPADLSDRDLGSMLESYDNFNELVTRFPESHYSPDARARMITLRNLFAEREYKTAKFYFDRGAYVAAANRASYVVRHYQQAPVVKDALVLLVRSYGKLELTEEAQQAQSILKLNYPT